MTTTAGVDPSAKCRKREWGRHDVSDIITRDTSCLQNNSSGIQCIFKKRHWKETCIEIQGIPREDKKSRRNRKSSSITLNRGEGRRLYTLTKVNWLACIWKSLGDFSFCLLSALNWNSFPSFCLYFSFGPSPFLVMHKSVTRITKHGI